MTGFWVSLLLPTKNLIPRHCNENAHQRADDIEEAEREISDGGYAQDSRLGHSAAAPRE